MIPTSFHSCTIIFPAHTRARAHTHAYITHSTRTRLHAAHIAHAEERASSPGHRPKLDTAHSQASLTVPMESSVRTGTTADPSRAPDDASTGIPENTVGHPVRFDTKVYSPSVYSRSALLCHDAEYCRVQCRSSTPWARNHAASAPTYLAITALDTRLRRLPPSTILFVRITHVTSLHTCHVASLPVKPTLP